MPCPNTKYEHIKFRRDHREDPFHHRELRRDYRKDQFEFRKPNKQRKNNNNETNALGTLFVLQRFGSGHLGVPPKEILRLPSQVEVEALFADLDFREGLREAQASGRQWP